MPTISLAGDAERYLRQRPDNRRYALITDGPAATQMAKIRALDLERRLDHVICTGAWGSGFDKPHPRAFQALEAWSGPGPRRSIWSMSPTTRPRTSSRQRRVAGGRCKSGGRSGSTR